MHEWDKTCWMNLCWSMEIVFALKKRVLGNVTMWQEMKGKVGVIRCRILGMGRYEWYHSDVVQGRTKAKAGGHVTS